jgi:hypothetical protein
MPRNGWYLADASVAFICAIIGTVELYYSHDWSKNWHGPAWIAIGLVWLFVAYRKPGDHRTK